MDPHTDPGEVGTGIITMLVIIIIAGIVRGMIHGIQAMVAITIAIVTMDMVDTILMAMEGTQVATIITVIIIITTIIMMMDIIMVIKEIKEIVNMAREIIMDQDMVGQQFPQPGVREGSLES